MAPLVASKCQRAKAAISAEAFAAKISQRSFRRRRDDDRSPALPFHVDARREERGAETADVGNEGGRARSSVVDG